MALIKCPECNHEVSDKAASCPNCGYILEKQELENKSEELQKQLKKETDNRKKIAIGIGAIVLVVIVISGMNLFKKGGLVDQLTDKEAPKLKNVPTELTYYVGDEVNFEDVIKKNNVQAVDNVDSDVDVQVDSSQVKLNEPGNYILTLKAEDRAKNEIKAEVPVQINDYETHKAYLAATTLDQSKLEKSNSGKYSYDGITIIDSEVQSIEAGTMYRSISKSLEGFYLFGKIIYDNWNADIVSTVFGIDKPSSYDEMKPYVDSVFSYIIPDATLPQILSWLQKCSTVSGDFDYEKGTFSFEISDLTSTASELHITEKMLGYTLAVIEEYGAETKFTGNSYTCKLQVVGDAARTDKNILTYEDFNASLDGVTSSTSSQNMIDSFNNDDVLCTWCFYDENVDAYREGVISTPRGIRLGMDYNSVVFKYGKGNEGEVSFAADDKIMQMLNETKRDSQDDSVDYYINQVSKYMAYKTQDGLYEMIFVFDNNNKLSWIFYDNSPVYS